MSAGPLSTGDKWFFRTTSIAANFAFVLVAFILIFLFLQAIPALTSQGLPFIYGTEWNNQSDPVVLQIGPMLWGSLLIGAIGIVFATPLAISLAYLIVFMLSARLAKVATTLVDLLAALPSVIIGLWGLFVFSPVAGEWAAILNNYLGWFPLFQVSTADNGFLGSPFIAGWIVAIMIVPIITSITREVFSQLDRDLINGALALGGSKYSTFRRVIFPTSAGAVVGAVLLGLGRALGETVAIFYVLQLTFNINWGQILEPNGGAVASMILAKFGEATQEEISGLIAAGLVLFVLTLGINFLASIIVNRAQPWRKL
ncbi:MAG: phosphate ABC transporter permease subunit PstC [Rhodoluna sp.]